jgi:hypothetical protein
MDSTERAKCQVIAAWLRATGAVSVLAWVMLTLLLLWIIDRSRWPLMLVWLPLAMVERVLVFRIRFDERLFAAWGACDSNTLEQLDRGLQALGITVKPGRDLESRIQGAKRLTKWYFAFVVGLMSAVAFCAFRPI